MGEFKAKSVHESIGHLSCMLDMYKRVFYSRFGDGDLYVMDGQRCSSHLASPELSAELAESFSIEDELFMKAASVGYPNEKGMAPGMFIEGSVGGGPSIIDFREKAKRMTNERDFYNPIVFPIFFILCF